MLLTIIITVLFIGSIILLDHARKHWDDPEGGWIIFAIITTVFIINGFFLLTSPAGCRADIKEFEAASITIQQQRENKLSEYERATLTKEIIDKNQWLAKEKFWADNIWLNWYYDKKILSVNPIK